MNGAVQVQRTTFAIIHLHVSHVRLALQKKSKAFNQWNHAARACI